MKKIILTALLVTSPLVLANGYYEDSRPYKRNGTPNYRYEGLSGKKYQYDLSDPIDRIDYQMDLDAQLRDKINPDPMIRMDDDFNQRGGGAED